MSEQWDQAKWDEAKKHIFARAGTDEAFRQKCLDDPQGVIAAVSGLSVPEGTKVRFVDPGDDHHTIILPRFQSADGELSDDDLDSVSGGFFDDSHDSCTFSSCND